MGHCADFVEVGQGGSCALDTLLLGEYENA